jgi:hypothetical protein
MANMQMTKFPSTFSANCDWVFGVRTSNYNLKWIPAKSSWGNISKHPRTIFVRTDLVQDFHDHILPCLSESFVLITGDHDATIPNQVDIRYKKFLAREAWHDLLSDSRVIHIFAEHLDERQDATRVTPIPVGLDQGEFPGKDVNFLRDKIVYSSHFSRRKFKVLRCDRVRKGGQWTERAKVRDLCTSKWSKWCDSANPTPLFDTLKTYVFVLCVHGGGIDPNPKAWEALLAGTIPIMKKFPGDAIYSNLPVVFVDEWDETTITEENLRNWMAQLAPMYEDESKRWKVVERLHEAYWWEKVQEQVRKVYSPVTAATESVSMTVCSKEFVSYESSDLEKRWLDGIFRWDGDACGQARLQYDDIMTWLNATHGNISIPESSPLKGSIFSFFRYRVRCPGKEDEMMVELIEPLASVLRDTRGVCAGFPSAPIGSKDFLLLGKSVSSGEPLSLFDFGATLWSGGDGRHVSQKWFWERYRELGFKLHHMYMFEVTAHPDAEIYNNVPTSLLPSFHYYNVPISEKSNEPFHAWTFVENSLSTEKLQPFVAVKLDIDTPSVEVPLVKQLIENNGLEGKVNEFFFEHHVKQQEMQILGWGGDVNGTLKDTYDFFISLRRKGIRAHAWP